MQKKTLVKNTIILTSSSLITRVLGFIYRIYLANEIGALGMGLYGLIIPIYMLCWSLACSGFTTTISKEVSSYSAKNDIYNQRRVLKLASIISTSIGVILSILLYILSTFIAKTFYMDTNLALPLKVMAFSIPFMALGSCIRGYFFGVQNSVVPALSQLLEQIARISVVFLLANIFIPLGNYYAVTLCILGITISEIISCTFVYICLKKSKKPKTINNFNKLSTKQMIVSIIIVALPLTLNRVSGSLLSSVENMLIPIKLQAFGMSQNEAIESFGKITGMTIPIIYFPSTLLTSISISLVPAISESISVGNKKAISSLVRKTISFTVIIGCLSGAIFTCFPLEIGSLIFKQDLSYHLFIFGLMCPLLYMQMITSGILNGLSEQLFIFKNSLLSSIIVIFFIYFFMPIFSLNAFLFGLFLSAIITNILALNKINQKSQTSTKIIDIFYLPCISALGATLITKLIYKTFIQNNFTQIYGLFLGLTIITFLYLVFVILTGAIKFSEITKLLKSFKAYLPNNSFPLI